MTATDAAGRIAAWLDANDGGNWIDDEGHDIVSPVTPVYGGRALTLRADDLRELLARRAAATARAAELEARLAGLGKPRTEHGQKYSGGGYLTRVDSDWMRERWPVDQWIWDNTRHGGVVGERKIIVVEDWREIRAKDLPEERPADAAPLCAHCGERNPDGSHNEHDRSWMCAPCHTAAARGDER